jgi:hypothetical protein
MRVMQRSSQPPPRAVEPSEGEVIACGQTSAMAVIDKFVDAEKASNPGLPRDVILQMAMHGSNCVCRVAQYILSKEQK